MKANDDRFSPSHNSDQKRPPARTTAGFAHRCSCGETHLLTATTDAIVHAQPYAKPCPSCSAPPWLQCVDASGAELRWFRTGLVHAKRV